MKYLPLMMLITLAPLATGQTLKIPPAIEKLGDRAAETVDVTLDPNMLRFAQQVTGDDPDAKRVLQGLKNLRVRSFEFDKEGEYSPADVESMRSQLGGTAWSRIAQVRSKRDRENVDVYMKVGANSVGGLVVLVAGPKELTIVDIDGDIRPEDLGRLGGKAGIPAMDLRFSEKAKEREKK